MEIIILLILIFFNGLCSMFEIALVSSKKFKLENNVRKGNKGAKVALELAANPSKFLSTVQMGITIIGILMGIVSGDKLSENLNSVLSDVPYISLYSHAISVTLVLLFMTYLSIVFGELVPKKIGLLYPETIACLLSRPMNILSKIAKPFIWLLISTNNAVMKIFGIKERKDGVSEEEIKAMVQTSADDGEIEKIEHSIVERVFDLGDRRASELMTHRMDVKCLDINFTLEELKLKIKEEMHTIYPVVDGSLDNLIGLVNLKMIFSNAFEKDFNLKNHIIKPIYVHDNTSAYKILEQFRVSGTHFSLVVDERGAITGIITMDDVLDALVGDMTEKHHTEYKMEEKEPNIWLADAQYPYFEMIRKFELDEEDNGEYDTIAGVILDVVGHIPVVGNSIEWHGYKIEITEMSDIRIEKVLITKL